MLYRFILCALVSLSAMMYGQSSSQSSTSPPPSSSPTPASPSDDRSSKPARSKTPDLSPPRSDRVNAGDLGNSVGESSSKDTQIDLSAPADDAKTHPQSSDVLMDAAGAAAGGSSVGEFHSWDPHKAAKSVEVGDFYFKRKNYRAAEARYREALSYKDNDAIATFRLAVCLEKLEQPQEARAEYESYLRILPHGPEAETALKAIERLKSPAANSKPPQ
jgi:tetratricopeptide (TPR) repeat protein